jgi:small redox-active disulfide protein 2
MNIKILGIGCQRCNDTEKAVRETVAELGVEAEIEKVTDLKLFASMGVLFTPGVVIDGEVKSQGKIPDRDEIRSWFSAPPTE